MVPLWIASMGLTWTRLLVVSVMGQMVTEAVRLYEG